MSGMILLRPLWLLALLPVLGLGLWISRRGGAAGGWDRVMPPPMLAAMRAVGALGGAAGGWVRWLPIAALLALVAGLSGPALRRADAPVLARTDSVLIAIDMSPSVAQGPALVQVQQAAAALLQGLAGRPVGLIVFSGEAYAAAAPTTDARTLQTLIGVLGRDTVPGQGSRPAAAIGLAAQMLADPAQSDLIVISDGGGVDRQAVSESARLADAGASIWVVRVEGSATDAPPPRPGDLSRLVRGRGQVVAGADVDRLASLLRRDGARRLDPAHSALGYLDLGPFLAALSALPLLMMLRRQR